MARPRERPSEKEAALREKSLDELREIARRNDISGFSGLNKEELLDLLMERRIEPDTYEGEIEVELTPDEVHAQQMELERLRARLQERYRTGSEPSRR
jgi:hypothetical protein